MAVDLSPEVTAELRRYVDGDLSNAELADWLVGAEYDAALPQDERDALAQIRLVVIEVEEGRRGTPEVLGVVAAVLASAAPEQTVTSFRSGSDTSWEGQQRRTATEARLQRVGI